MCKYYFAYLECPECNALHHPIRIVDRCKYVASSKAMVHKHKGLLERFHIVSDEHHHHGDCLHKDTIQQDLIRRNSDKSDSSDSTKQDTVQKSIIKRYMAKNAAKKQANAQKKKKDEKPAPQLIDGPWHFLPVHDAYMNNLNRGPFPYHSGFLAYTDASASLCDQCLWYLTEGDEHKASSELAQAQDEADKEKFVQAREAKWPAHMPVGAQDKERRMFDMKALGCLLGTPRVVSEKEYWRKRVEGAGPLFGHGAGENDDGVTGQRSRCGRRGWDGVENGRG